MFVTNVGGGGMGQTLTKTCRMPRGSQKANCIRLGAHQNLTYNDQQLSIAEIYGLLLSPVYIKHMGVRSPEAHVDSDAYTFVLLTLGRTYSLCTKLIAIAHTFKIADALVIYREPWRSLICPESDIL